MPSPLLKHTFPTIDCPTPANQRQRQGLLRVELPFPAIVRGMDAADHAFEEQTVLDSLSANSLALTLQRRIEVGAKLFLVVRLSADPAARGPAPRVALCGTVDRVTPQTDGTYALAVMFARYRFLYRSGEETVWPGPARG